MLALMINALLDDYQGTALFTMGTREMDATEEERSGLASKHAYAVLDVVEVVVLL